jgi:VWFA-related protein
MAGPDRRRTGWAVAVIVALAAGSTWGAGGQPQRAAQASPDRIRVGVELVTTPVTVRDRSGRFLSDLEHSEFELYEDSVPQTIVTFSLSHGGRLFHRSQPPKPTGAGIILPPPRPPADSSGRVFLIFIDDAHLEASQTPRLRELFGRITARLIRPGDKFGILSTGPSAIAVDLTYDRKRLEETANRIMGNGLSPSDILSAPSGTQGPAEVRHRAHVAFSTAYEVVGNLGKMHDRRKAMIYLSNGYDLNPFADAREKQDKERAGDSETNPFRNQATFSDADLVAQLSELTRAAVRANVEIHTIDPRGLTAGPDISQPIDAVSYQRYVSKTQDTLRVLAEQTGGQAVVNQNDFDKALALIDAATSDYYMLGYYSSNADPAKRRRTIQIKVKRPHVDVSHRNEYTIRPAR